MLRNAALQTASASVFLPLTTNMSLLRNLENEERGSYELIHHILAHGAANSAFNERPAREHNIQGAASVRATRKPKPLSRRSEEVSQTRSAERRFSGSLSQEPPRMIWLLQSPPVAHAEPSVGAPI